MTSKIIVNNIEADTGVSTVTFNSNIQGNLIGNVTGNVNSTGVTTVTSLRIGTGTSISSPATNVLALGTNNVEVARFDSSGRLGIGTDIPSSYDSGARTLVLSESLYSGITLRTNNQSTGQNAIYFSDGLTGNEAYRGRIEYSHSSDSLNFGTAGTGSRVNIDSSGRLLVGTNTARSNFFNTNTISSTFQIEGAGNGNPASRFASMVFGQSGSDDPIFILAKHRSSSVGGISAVQSGDYLGRISFHGSDGTEFVEAAQIGALVDATPGANDMPGSLVFATTSDGASSPTERARFNSSGAFVLAGGTTTANGIGIAFPATQSASTDANTLDDYEEGTWTPSYTSSGASFTYSAQNGFYIKVGRLVTASCYIGCTGVTGTTSGQVNLTGLPFNNDFDYACANIGQLFNVDWPASAKQMQCYISSGNTTATLKWGIDNGAESAVTALEIAGTAPTGFMISVSYRTAS